MNMCIQFMRCAWHKIALFLCGDLTRFELVDFYILRYGTGYVAFIAGTRLILTWGWFTQAVFERMYSDVRGDGRDTDVNITVLYLQYVLICC